MPLPLSGASPTWAPILSGPDADRARTTIDEIADALRDPSVTDIDPDFATSGIAGGSSGAAVFFAQIGDEKTALDFLDRAIERAAEDMPTLPLYVGTPGVGWAMAYLERSVLDAEPGDNDVDELVDVGLNSERWVARNEFDLIRGIVGLGVYLLERRRSLDGVVAALAKTATETEHGHTWWVDPQTVPPERRELFPSGYYDAGMAHGQAGVIAVLAHALEAGTESARPLLESTLRWLRAYRLPEERGPGRYPLLFGPDEPPTGGRMAWCYGDIGVAVALLAAGQALGDEETLQEAYDLALECAARPFDRTGAIDASLCHGTSGIALLFARLAHAFGDERLYEATREWARLILKQRIDGQPIAGYQYSVPKGDDRGWEPRAGLLEGAIGPGLVLHALTTDSPPDWDLLFLSRPLR